MIHPTTLSGPPRSPLPAAAAKRVKDIELVFDPRILEVGRIDANLLNKAFFISGISGMA